MRRVVNLEHTQGVFRGVRKGKTGEKPGRCAMAGLAMLVLAVAAVVMVLLAQGGERPGADLDPRTHERLPSGSGR